MTNFRIGANKNDIQEFKYCFTCGAELKEETYDDGSIGLTCSRNWVHVKMSINEYDDDETQFS